MRMALIAFVMVAGCSSTPDTKEEKKDEVIVGGDKDEHGCIGSAGYTWCAKENTCARSWELAAEKGFENTMEAFNAYCSQ